jgi:uncharacterized protein (DUF2267 family)
MKTAGKQEQDRTPHLNSEVKFADGKAAGIIVVLNARDFVVARGKKRVSRLILPYSIIQSVGERIVTLKMTKTELSQRGANPSEKEGLSKRNFVLELDERLALDNPERTERIARIVLYLLSKRLSAEKKKRLKKNLPLGIRSLWAAVEQGGTVQYFNMADFLIPVKKQGRLQSMEEAFIVTREVFACLRRMMPVEDALDISRSLPLELREIWEGAVQEVSQNPVAV